MEGLLVPIDIGLSTGLIYAWAVLALAVAFRLLDFPDLTIEGSVPLGACVFASLLSSGTPKLLAVLGGVSAGAAAGAATALLHLRFRLNKFLAGILVVAICYSLSLRVMGDASSVRAIVSGSPKTSCAMSPGKPASLKHCRIAAALAGVS